jgi:hypothetical protein
MQKCGTEEETSVHVLCECETLASLRHAYLGSFILDPEHIKNVIMGAACHSYSIDKLILFKNDS